MEKNNQAILEQMKVTAQLVDEMISLKEYGDRMKEGQNDSYHMTSVARALPG